MKKEPVNAQMHEVMSKVFASLPHARALGFEYLGTQGKKTTLKVNWKDELVGSPATLVIHGGVITSLVDTSSAASVTAVLADYETIATLDLRIDYLKAAEPQLPIYCEAECYKLASQIAFTRAICYQRNINDPIAHGVATFMRESSPVPMHKKAEEGKDAK